MHGAELHQINPVLVAAWREQHKGSLPTIKQHLAAVKMLFDYLVIGGVIPMNPASSVRGPKYSIKRGKTPVLTADQVRSLIDSISTKELIGLRDRAIIGVMVFTFARVGATVALHVEDYFASGKKWRIQLHEKGGKLHDVPAHHSCEELLDPYIKAMDKVMSDMKKLDEEIVELSNDKKAFIFQSIRWNKKSKRMEPTGRPLSQADVYRMIRRRAAATDLDVAICCHTFRAAGITDFLKNDGTLEKAQLIANHASPRTTKLYDRNDDDIMLEEIERIHI